MNNNNNNNIYDDSRSDLLYSPRTGAQLNDPLVRKIGGRHFCLKLDVLCQHDAAVPHGIGCLHRVSLIRCIGNVRVQDDLSPRNKEALPVRGALAERHGREGGPAQRQQSHERAVG